MFDQDGLPNNSPSGKAGRIRAMLERRFETGFYRFGEKLSVNDLVKEFHVSRQPIMTALGELRSDGFVIITPQVGCEAVSPSKTVIQDFFSVFAKMEGKIAGLAAQRREEKELDLLREVLARIEVVPGHPTQWESGALGTDVSRFHEVIRQMARSPSVAHRLGRFWIMANYIIRNARHNYSERLHKIANEERRAIIAAIAESDEETAESRMEKHILGKPARVGLL